MTIKRFWKMSLYLLPLLWFGCATQQPVVPQIHETKEHLHSQALIRSFGDQHYNAVLNYDGAEGVLKINFLDKNEKPVKIFKDKHAKASLRLPQGKIYRFNFHNSGSTGNYLTFYFSGRFIEQDYFSDTIYTRKDWLKNRSAFTLWISVPIGETTYLLEYMFPEENQS